MANSYLQKIFIKIGYGFIFCNICGGLRKIKIKSSNLREDCLCKRCKSNSRKRHLALVILETVYNNAYKSFKEIHKNSEFKIFNTESNGAIHDYLKHVNNYVCSEYFGPYETFGKEKDGVLNIDLMDIPFNENIFDLVISTEVFEHIPDPYKAFKEVHRILKPGGRHIFTVPFYDNKEKDEVRSVLNDKNEIVYLLEPQYHGDPIRSEDGVLVYTIFAKEMIGKLERLGFSVITDLHTAGKNGIFGLSYVFSAIKNA